jgi:hypothetical protein
MRIKPKMTTTELKTNLKVVDMLSRFYFLKTAKSEILHCFGGSDMIHIDTFDLAETRHE